MIDNAELLERHMLPRWRLLHRSIAEGEMSGTEAGAKNSTQSYLTEVGLKQTELEFLQHKAAWDDSGDVYFAEELLSTALLLEKQTDPSVLRAAAKISTTGHLRDGIKRLAHEFLHDEEEADLSPFLRKEGLLRLEIHKRKKLLIINPQDGLRAAETALLYAIIGQRHISRKLMERALAVCPNDRYVLRAAARFFSHVGEPDVADDRLARSPRTRVDPWLASAHLATSALAGRSPTRWKSIKLMLDNDSFSLRDRSELASEAGTLVLRDGARRRAIRLLKFGAVDPTENTVAQIEWLGRKDLAVHPQEILSDVTISHEAKANTAYWHAEWDNALDACDEWQALEPFSTRPAIFGAFLSAVSYSSLERGYAIGEASLKSNPNDGMLLNNLAVLSAYRNDLGKAQELFNRIHRRANDPKEVMLTATEGLIQFRSGNAIKGAQLYSDAIKKASASKKHITVLRAYCFLSREIAHSIGRRAPTTVEDIDEMILKLNRHGYQIPQDVRVIRDQLENVDIVSNELLQDHETCLGLLAPPPCDLE